MKSALDAGSLVVATNFTILGASSPDGTAPKLRAKDSQATFTNLAGIFIGRRPYFGCAMGLTAEARDLVLPVPSYVEAHDLWIAIIGNVSRRITHVEMDSVERRLHDNNLTPEHRRRLWRVALSRFGFARAVVQARRRVIRESRRSLA
jgi:hypothetical protein